MTHTNMNNPSNYAFIEKRLILYCKDIDFSKQTRENYCLFIPDKVTLKDFDLIIKLYLETSTLLINCSKLCIYIFLHGTIFKGKFLIDQIPANDFGKIILKYFSHVPIRFINTCCNSILFHEIMYKTNLLPTSEVITFTDDITSIMSHVNKQNLIVDIFTQIHNQMYHKKTICLLISKKNYDGSISYRFLNNKLKATAKDLTEIFPILHYFERTNKAYEKFYTYYFRNNKEQLSYDLFFSYMENHLMVQERFFSNLNTMTDHTKHFRLLKYFNIKWSWLNTKLYQAPNGFCTNTSHIVPYIFSGNNVSFEELHKILLFFLQDSPEHVKYSSPYGKFILYLNFIYTNCFYKCRYNFMFIFYERWVIICIRFIKKYVPLSLRKILISYNRFK